MDARTDGHTPTDKPRTNAMATLMHPAGPPHQHGTLPVARGPWPPAWEGRWALPRDGGQLSQPHSSGHGGTQPPTLPQGMASWEGNPTGPGAPAWGQIAGSQPCRDKGADSQPCRISLLGSQAWLALAEAQAGIQSLGSQPELGTSLEPPCPGAALSQAPGAALFQPFPSFMSGGCRVEEELASHRSSPSCVRTTFGSFLKDLFCYLIFY